MKKTIAILLLLFSWFSDSIGRDFSFNLASLDKGNKAVRSVWIVNTSTSPLTILNIETGCVCTKADFSKKPIPIGDSTKVYITFSAKDPGVFYKIIYIKTTDKNCDSKITIRGKVN